MQKTTRVFFFLKKFLKKFYSLVTLAAKSQNDDDVMDGLSVADSRKKMVSSEAVRDSRAAALSIVVYCLYSQVPNSFHSRPKKSPSFHRFPLISWPCHRHTRLMFRDWCVQRLSRTSTQQRTGSSFESGQDEDSGASWTRRSSSTAKFQTTSTVHQPQQFNITATISDDHVRFSIFPFLFDWFFYFFIFWGVREEPWLSLG